MQKFFMSLVIIEARCHTSKDELSAWLSG